MSNPRDTNYKTRKQLYCLLVLLIVCLPMATISMYTFFFKALKSKKNFTDNVVIESSHHQIGLVKIYLLV